MLDLKFKYTNHLYPMLDRCAGSMNRVHIAPTIYYWWMYCDRFHRSKLCRRYFSGAKIRGIISCKPFINFTSRVESTSSLEQREDNSGQMMVANHRTNHRLNHPGIIIFNLLVNKNHSFESGWPITIEKPSKSWQFRWYRLDRISKCDCISFTCTDFIA